MLLGEKKVNFLIGGRKLGFTMQFPNMQQFEMSSKWLWRRLT